MTILLPASTASVATSPMVAFVSAMPSCRALIVSGSLPPKKDCSQANCADCKASLMALKLNFKGVIARVNRLVTTFPSASKFSVAEETDLKTSVNTVKT